MVMRAIRRHITPYNVFLLVFGAAVAFMTFVYIRALSNERGFGIEPPATVALTAGTYIAHHELGEVRLELGRDGNFVLQVPDSTVLQQLFGARIDSGRASGTWDWTSREYHRGRLRLRTPEKGNARLREAPFKLSRHYSGLTIPMETDDTYLSFGRAP